MYGARQLAPARRPQHRLARLFTSVEELKPVIARHAGGWGGGVLIGVTTYKTLCGSDSEQPVNPPVAKSAIGRDPICDGTDALPCGDADVIYLFISVVTPGKASCGVVVFW